MPNLDTKIIMSKKVAKRYLDRVAVEGRTLTVFFNSTEDLANFVGQVEGMGSDNITTRLGFDEVTFITTDGDTMETIKDMVEDYGLDSSEI